jgi:hypothetical protein
LIVIEVGGFRAVLEFDGKNACYEVFSLSNKINIYGIWMSNFSTIPSI